MTGLSKSMQIFLGSATEMGNVVSAALLIEPAERRWGRNWAVLKNRLIMQSLINQDWKAGEGGIMGRLPCGYGFPSLKPKSGESKAVQPRPLLPGNSPASTGLRSL